MMNDYSHNQITAHRTHAFTTGQSYNQPNGESIYNTTGSFTSHLQVVAIAPKFRVRIMCTFTEKRTM